jgi:hypothetical protein
VHYLVNKQPQGAEPRQAARHALLLDEVEETLREDPGNPVALAIQAEKDPSQAAALSGVLEGLRTWKDALAIQHRAVDVLAEERRTVRTSSGWRGWRRRAERRGRPRRLSRQIRSPERRTRVRGADLGS